MRRFRVLRGLHTGLGGHGENRIGGGRIQCVEGLLGPGEEIQRVSDETVTQGADRGFHGVRIFMDMVDQRAVYECPVAEKCTGSLAEPCAAGTQGGQKNHVQT